MILSDFKYLTDIFGVNHKFNDLAKRIIELFFVTTSK